MTSTLPVGNQVSPAGPSLRTLQRATAADLEAITGDRLLPPVVRYDPDRDREPLPSHTASWLDVCHTSTAHDDYKPVLTTGWPDRWSVAYRHGEDEQTATVREVNPVDLLDADPIRNSTWHRNSRARAGLHFMATTERLHWHESLFERELLIALDFDEGFNDLASQPFTLSWHDGHRLRSHTPDFAAVIDGEMWIVNVRPAPLVKPQLLENAAATRAMCALHGWREALVVGYAQPAHTVLKTIGAARRTADPYSLGGEMLDLLADWGPTRFGDLVAATGVPVLARAVLQRLIWDREAAIDLTRLLTDETYVALPAEVAA
ncbi:MAG: TnsA-like heteromeric transposase endonuclease subunit [Actinomycetota bacterium]|nr:TnsA-like heteromeric transposase endonuclease subunit [Actinomycetota bacterium]